VSSTGQACCGVLLQVRVVCQFLGLGISGALHLVIFEQPAENDFLSKLLRNKIVFVLSLIVKPE